MDRSPRIPTGGTAGTGYMLATVGRGLRYREKVCSNPTCGRSFRTPPEAELHVVKPMCDASGQETPCYWYASTRETRINNAQEYSAPRRMLKKEAEHYFTVVLGIIAAPKPRPGGLTAQEALAYYADAASRVDLRVYRKMPAPSIMECRSCYNKRQRHLAKVLASETIIIRHKKGKRTVSVTTLTPNAPTKADDAKPKKRRTRKTASEETPKIWFCTTPSTREEPSRTVRTPKEMTLHDAKAWFRFHLSRLNLSGCSITG